MFIKAQVFKRFIKMSCKEGTLVVGHRPDKEEYFIAGHGWCVNVFDARISNKCKAALIEYIGELPNGNEVYNVIGENKQYTFENNEFWHVSDYYDMCFDTYAVTPVLVQHGEQCIVQNVGTGELCLLNVMGMGMISNGEIEEEKGEETFTGPVGGCKELPGWLLWQNDIMTLGLHTSYRNDDNEVEREILSVLSAVDMAR